MDTNTEERRQGKENLRALATWLDDAQVWIDLAKQLIRESGGGQEDNLVSHPKMNVACACTVSAFQLAYKSLLIAEAKSPREKDGVERLHGRLQKESQSRIQRWVAEEGFDISILLKNLDKHINNYGMESGMVNRRFQFDISVLAKILDKLVKLAEKKLTDARNAIPPGQPKPETDLNTVLNKIGEIARASEGGDYIYRGEPEHYDRVTSNLYRHYESDIEAANFEIEAAQAEMLKQTKSYVDEGSDFEILTLLQHYGGKTNLIDFTTDYLVALFFACDGFRDDDGRILLVKQTEEVKKIYRVTTPRNPQNRVIAQKSIFVRPPKGFIELDSEINIPRRLKKPMLDYLRKHHAISTETIYNDLHGFIRNQDLHESAYTEFFKGKTCQDNENYLKAIVHYTEASRLNSQLPEVYNNRGNVYDKLGKRDCAIKDYSTAIELRSDDLHPFLNRGLTYYDKGEYGRAIQDLGSAIDLEPGWSQAHYKRGMARLHLHDWAGAKTDLTTARNKGFNIALAFLLSYESVFHFEQIIGGSLPDDIAIMLEPT